MKTMIKPKTTKELANDYECSTRTIRRMCEEISIFSKKRLTTKEVKKFYESFGLPLLEMN